MSNGVNTICFGQQSCGFFPKRFLVAKINTAKKLQQETGGKIVFFYHDSDADYRETITVMSDKSNGAEVRLNFLQPNKIQKKFSPFYAKNIIAGWKNDILKQLPRFVDKEMVNIFSSIDESQSVADFCLEMYTKMGLLEGVEVLRSSDVNLRKQAIDLDKDYFADVQYQDETVRAQQINEKLMLHEGGGKYITLPDQKIEKSQKSPHHDQRFAWMQSVINCTHYIYGEGEAEYLKFDDFPEVKFVPREKIENSDHAWLQ